MEPLAALVLTALATATGAAGILWVRRVERHNAETQYALLEESLTEARARIADAEHQAQAACTLADRAEARAFAAERQLEDSRTRSEAQGESQLEVERRLRAAEQAQTLAEQALERCRRVAERAIEQLKSEAERARQAQLHAETKLAEGRSELETHRRSARAAGEELAQVRSTLELLGLTSLEDPADPFEPGRRPRTAEVLEGLLLDAQANAAAVIDRRGWTLAHTGDPDAARRLGAWGRIAFELKKPLEEALGGRLLGLSWCRDFRGTHALSIDAHDRWLALEGRSEPPTLTLRYAALRLGAFLPSRSETGLPGPSASAITPELMDGAHLRAQELIRHWVRRWQVPAALVAKPDEVVLAASPAAVPKTLVRVAQAVAPVVGRALRDGFAPSRSRLSAQTLRDRWLTVVPLLDERDTPLLIVASGFWVGEAALFELTEALRRQASGSLRTVS